MELAPDVVILAAGRGKRMCSEIPKVLHPVLGQPMLHHVLDVVSAIPHGAILVVIGHGADRVMAESKPYQGIQWVEQSEPLGTGHAVLQARPLLGKGRSVLIVCGDVILLSPPTLGRLIAERTDGASAAVLTARLESPTGYGRIIRDGEFIRAIREEKDCSTREKEILEVNAGIYLFETQALFKALDALTPNNAQKEYYLTDTIAFLTETGCRVVPVRLDDPTEALGINDRAALAQVGQILRKRNNERWMAAGVTLEDPDNIWIDHRTRIGADVRIETGCRIQESTISSGTSIESGCRIIRCSIGMNSTIRQGSYLTDSRLGDEVTVGPYAHLRPGSSLGDRAKIGNFVEIKNSSFGEDSKASHLSYIGDATIGKMVNLGCGFITCNYDGGKQKHTTRIGDGVFVGSDSQMVAPVEIGAGSYVASGTTVTHDVPENSLVLSRGRQITKAGYARKYRKGE